MSGCNLSLILTGLAASSQRSVTITHAVIAGWTGRDPKSVRKHIQELEELGVPAPKSTPSFYRISATRLTTADSIEVIGENSSGEVEFVLMQLAGELWLGVGSDHTDRSVESYDVGISKQVCDKPIAPSVWRFADVVDHWDSLILRSYIGQERTEYQAGIVTSILEPQALISAYHGGDQFQDGTLMFCGTLPAMGGIRPASLFSLEIEDPVLGRTIRHEYGVRQLDPR